MKFSTTKSDLQSSLQKLSKIIPNRTTIPILGNVLVVSREGSIKMRATDLEQTMILSIPATIEKEGRAVIPVDTLLNITNELPNIRITINIDDNQNITIICDTGKYSIKGMNEKEYPVSPEFNDKTSFEMESKQLKKIISLTSFAISKDELKPALTGILMQVKENKLTIVSTDGHRLVRYKINNFDSKGFEGEIIIPRKFLNLSQSLTAETKVIKFQIGKNYITASFGLYKIYSRIIDEQYPDFESVIPENNDKTIFIDNKNLISAVKRVSIFSNRTTQQISIKIEKNYIEVGTEDPEKATKAKEKIKVKYEGESFTIGYNALYLKELLSFIPSDNIFIKLKTPISATVFYPETNEQNTETTMLLMPIRLND